MLTIVKASSVTTVWSQSYCFDQWQRYCSGSRQLHTQYNSVVLEEPQKMSQLPLNDQKLLLKLLCHVILRTL